MPRHADPELENRVLNAAQMLWKRGGEKALTMRAVARAAGTYAGGVPAIQRPARPGAGLAVADCESHPGGLCRGKRWKRWRRPMSTPHCRNRTSTNCSTPTHGIVAAEGQREAETDPGVAAELPLCGATAGEANRRRGGRPHATGTGGLGHAARYDNAVFFEIDSGRA